MRKLYILTFGYLCFFLFLGYASMVKAYEYRFTRHGTIYIAQEDEIIEDEDVEDDFEDEDYLDEETGPIIGDPIQSFNHAMFVFNDKLYFWFLKPLAQGWGFINPERARISLNRFFHNLLFPVRFFNCLFQAKWKGSGVEASRFGLNTTIGLLGFFDPAKAWFDLEPYEEDFGQTLGVWGTGHGFYLTLPCSGPSTVRDGIGKIPDTALSPLTYLPGAGLLQRLNLTSLKMGEYENLKAAALNPYIAIRDAYVQYRNALTEK